MKKRTVLSLVLILCLVLTALPMTANAASGHKNGVYIMLDAGHYAHYNKGAHPDYWESKQMWTLTEYLKDELEKYPGFVVGTTRKDQTKDLDLYTRGAKAKNYDLFISMHSNSGGKTADYPLAIVSANGSLNDYAKPIGRALAQTIEDVMNTNDSYQLWTKKQKDGRDWYGVLRGAAGVGTPGIILEHSFHSNYSKAKWLLSDTNLRMLASYEAKCLADYYGLTLDGDFDAPATPVLLKVTGEDAFSVTAEWENAEWTTGYEVYRSSTRDGEYEHIDTVLDRGNTYTDTKLEFDKEYYYKVRGFRSFNGETKYGPESNIVSGKTVLSSPEKFSAAGNGYNKNKLTWSKVPGADSYDIYRADKGSKNFTKIETLSKSKTSYTDYDVEWNKTYTYKMRANKKNDSGVVKHSKFTKEDTAKPIVAKPELSVGRGKTALRVKWKAVPDADNYRVTMSTDGKTYKQLAICDSETLDFRAENLSPKTKYYFKVCANVIDNGVKYRSAYTAISATTK